MVDTAAVFVTEPLPYAESGSIVERAAKKPSAYAQSVSAMKLTLRQTTEEREPRPPDVEFTVLVPSVTGAQLPSIGTERLIVRTADNISRSSPGKAQRSASLSELPRTGHIVTSFEPHLRQSTVKKLLALIGQFRYSIGQPEAAAAKAELREVLTDTYKKTALNRDTRNLATAISLLQDFLRPHWSQISTQKLDAISDKLVWLGGERDLTPRILEQFYRQLVDVLGSRVYLDVETESEETDDTSE